MLVGQLFVWYQGLEAFSKLSPNSQRAYRLWLKTAFKHIGHLPVSKVKAQEADSLRRHVASESGIPQSIQVCKLMRRVWYLANRYEHATQNPFAKMDLPEGSGREELWQEEEVLRAIALCQARQTPSLGLLIALCYYLCQRPVDMRTLKWENYDGEYLRFTQTKTGMDMSIYAPPQLNKMLKKTKKVSEYIVVREDTGNPYTDRDYNHLLMEIKRLAKIPKSRQLRDLRRTGGTEMADKDATDAQMLSVLGHTTPKYLRVYRRPTVKQTKMAMTKRFS